MAKTTKTEPKPKTYTLTEVQFQQLRDTATDLMDIRRTLDDLEGEENISIIMFKVGKAFNIADVAETELDSFLDQFSEECDECEDDY
jgi:hypothetical protein